MRIANAAWGVAALERALRLVEDWINAGALND
jgi:hypothetical protein